MTSSEEHVVSLGPRSVRYLAVVVGIVGLVALVMVYRKTEMLSTSDSYRVTARNIRVVVHPNITLPDRPRVEQLTSEVEWDWNWDRRGQVNATSKAARIMVLVRHGKYNFSSGLLDNIGHQQANITGHRLSQMSFTPDVIVHSTMPRARETAAIIAENHFRQVPVTSDPLLEEGGPVQPHPPISYWGLPDRDYHVSSPRIEAAFRKYFHRVDDGQGRNERVLLVGHGNCLRYFVLRALQLDRRAWMRIFLAHGSITVVNIYTDGAVSVTKLGDSGHFPPDLVTY